MSRGDPRNTPTQPFRPAEVESISQCGSIQYGRVTTYRHVELRRGSGQLDARYETPTAIMARLEYEEGWTPVTVTWDVDQTWCHIFVRRDLMVPSRREISERYEREVAP